MEFIRPVTDVLTGISLLMLAYLGVFALYTRLRDRREDRGRFTLTFLAQTNLLTNVWIDFPAASRLYEETKKEGLIKSNEIPDDENLEKAFNQLAQYEAIALGIRKNLLDEELLYDFLNLQITTVFEQSRGIIEQSRISDEDPTVFSDFEALARRWMARK